MALPLAVPRIPKLLLVDRDATVRGLVAKSLSGDLWAHRSIHTLDTSMGTAIRNFAPDVVVVDPSGQPGSGLRLLHDLRRWLPGAIIVVFSETCGPEWVSRAASDAGADHCLVKSGLSSTTSVLVRHLGILRQRIGRPDQPDRAIVIAASTGGPQALPALLGALAGPLVVPILVVQHIRHGFDTALVKRLARACPMPVRLAKLGDPVRSGQLLVAPCGLHMAISHDGPAQITLHNSPRKHGVRPAADVLFTTAAGRWKSHTTGIVLTGMGQDGLVGCRAIHAAGGRVWVQDEASSTVWGMPGSVAKAGLAQEILTLEALANRISSTFA